MRSEAEVRDMYERCGGMPYNPVASGVVTTLRWVLGDVADDAISRLRPKGYYWIKIADQWEVAEWDDDRWFTCASDVELADHKVQEVGRRIPDHGSAKGGNK